MKRTIDMNDWVAAVTEQRNNALDQLAQTEAYVRLLERKIAENTAAACEVGADATGQDK